jgi:hypothetical protein
MVSKTLEEIRYEFNEAVSRLEEFARLYEQGRREFSKDMANILRQVLHDKGRQESLLAQLSKKTMRYFGTPNPLRDTAAANQWPLVRIGGRAFLCDQDDIKAYADYEPVYWAFGGFGFDDLSYAGEGVPPWNRLPFEDWWKEPVLVLAGVGTFTREELVLTVAERLAGVHGDRRNLTTEELAVLRQENFRPELVVAGKAFVPSHSMYYACIRQITYEVQKTLDAEAKDLLNREATVPPLQKHEGHPSLSIQLDVEYERKVLAALEREGEGDSVLAERIRARIYWEGRLVGW